MLIEEKFSQQLSLDDLDSVSGGVVINGQSFDIKDEQGQVSDAAIQQLLGFLAQAEALPFFAPGVAQVKASKTPEELKTNLAGIYVTCTNEEAAILINYL